MRKGGTGAALLMDETRMSSGRSEGTGAMVGTANQLPEPGEKLAAEAEFIADEVGISRSAQREFRLRHQHFQRQRGEPVQSVARDE